VLLPNQFLGASSGILVIQVVCDRPTSCSARLTLCLPFLPQEEGSREQEEEEEAEEEKRVILVAGVRVQEGDGGRPAGSPPPRPTAGACGLKPPPSPLFRCLSFRDLGVG